MLLLTHTIPFAVTESTVIDDDDDDRDVKLQKAKKRKGKERNRASSFFLSLFFSSPSKISHGERVRRGKEKATKREKRDRDLSISSSGLFFVFFFSTS